MRAELAVEGVLDDVLFMCNACLDLGDVETMNDFREWMDHYRDVIDTRSERPEKWAEAAMRSRKLRTP